MSHVFDSEQDPQALNFHLVVRTSLLPILDYIDQNQLHETDEFALTVRRGFAQIVKWIESKYETDALQAPAQPVKLPDPTRYELLPLAEVAERTGYSPQRLSSLLKDGRLRGEKRRGPTQPVWYTTVASVEQYMNYTLTR